MKRIYIFMLIICIMFSAVIPVSTNSNLANGMYVDEFENYMLSMGYGPNYEGEEWYIYSESYNYYSPDNDTSIPDWVLVNGCYRGMSPMFCYGVFGEYYIQKSNYYVPYSLGYYIYVPTDNNFYTLEQAWISEFDGIENVFIESLIPRGIAGYIGDADNDNNLTVLDATYIQRTLAGLCTFNSYDDMTSRKNLTDTEPLLYVSDIDRDGNRTVMDATAIQKKLAKQ